MHKYILQKYIVPHVYTKCEGQLGKSISITYTYKNCTFVGTPKKKKKKEETLLLREGRSLYLQLHIYIYILMGTVFKILKREQKPQKNRPEYWTTKHQYTYITSNALLGCYHLLELLIFKIHPGTIPLSLCINHT